MLFSIDTYVLIDQYSNFDILNIRKAMFCMHEKKNKTGEERVKVWMFLSLGYWMFYGNWYDSLPKDQIDENYEFRESNLSKKEGNLLSMLERMIWPLTAFWASRLLRFIDSDFSFISWRLR